MKLVLKKGKILLLMILSVLILNIGLSVGSYLTCFFSPNPKYGYQRDYSGGNAVGSGTYLNIDGTGWAMWIFTRSELSGGSYSTAQWNAENIRTYGIGVYGEDDAFWGDGADFYAGPWLDVHSNEGAGPVYMFNIDGSLQDYGAEKSIENLFNGAPYPEMWGYTDGGNTAIGADNGSSDYLILHYCWAYFDLDLEGIHDDFAVLDYFFAIQDCDIDRIHWKPRGEKDCKGYNIYGKQDEASTFVKINKSLIKKKSSKTGTKNRYIYEVPTGKYTIYKIEKFYSTSNVIDFGPIELVTPESKRMRVVGN